MFVPRILINMAAGHLTMKYGYQVKVVDVRDVLAFLLMIMDRAQIMPSQQLVLQERMLLEMLCDSFNMGMQTS